uniref:Uncharacterized protein n=1 Tax=viral metagenome TaxID=1070528 RepID=A0A6C0HL35_9ZZZZ
MLRARDLWKQTEDLRSANMQAMRPVLTTLFAQVKTHAATNPNAPYMTFDVPSFVFGYPLYNHREAIDYIKETLEEQGFTVWVAYNGTLLISWMRAANGKARQTTSSKPAGSADYRPFVYDESAMEATLSRLR